MSARAPYDDWVDIYDTWVETAPVCVENGRFFADLLAAADGVAVELGVGTGRIALEVARRGHPVVGVDTSAAMLAECRARAQALGVGDRVTLLNADARTFTLEEPAAVVAFPFHSIGHLLTLADKAALVRHVFGVLRPGGRFVFDHFVLDEDLARRTSDVPRLRAEIRDAASGRDVLLWVTVRHDLPRQTLRILATTQTLDEGGVVVGQKVRRLDFSWLTPAQCRGLLEEAGFVVEHLWGDFARGPFTPASREQVWEARRPA